jgi:hypothetical protein
MKAMVEAQKAKCDVINMSLGSDAPWSEQPHAAFAQELSSQGISGNSSLFISFFKISLIFIISRGLKW